MLQVILPHALVLGTINVLVNAATIGLVIGPISVIDISIDMNKATLTMSPILTPFTAIPGSVVPRLLTEAVSEASLPLTCVNSSRLEGIWCTLLALLVWPIDVLGDSLTRLLLSEVLARAELLCPQH